MDTLGKPKVRSREIHLIMSKTKVEVVRNYVKHTSSSIGNGGSGAVSTNGSTSLDPPHPPGRVWSISTPK